MVKHCNEVVTTYICTVGQVTKIFLIGKLGRAFLFRKGGKEIRCFSGDHMVFMWEKRGQSFPTEYKRRGRPYKIDCK